MEDEPRVYLGSEATEMPFNDDFQDKSVENVIEQIKEQVLNVL